MAEDLDSIARQAGQLGPAADEGQGEGQGEGAQLEAAPPPQLDNFQALGMMMAMAREALCLTLKVESPRATLADPAIEPLAKAWAMVLDERGIDLSKFGGTITMALGITAPVAFAVYRGLAAELAARRASEPEAVAPATVAADGG